MDSCINSMKNVLITGVAGFIGSNCYKYLSRLGYNVYGLDVNKSNPKNCISGPVTESNLSLFDTKFDYIFHFAGSPTVIAAQMCPKVAYSNDIESIKELLNYVLKYNHDAKIIFASSAAVYGSKHIGNIAEIDECRPLSLYGKLKLECESIIKDYFNKYSVNFCIMRLFSVYGAGLKKQVVWDFCNKISSLSNIKNFICSGTGNETRDFINIADVLQIFYLLLHCEFSSLTINCATGNAVKMDDIFNIIKREFGYDFELVYDNVTRKYDPVNLTANIALLKTLGFEPKVLVEDGIADYVKWYQNRKN